MLTLNTTCSALNWIASRAQYTTSDEFEGSTWDAFVFQGRINRAMVREIRAFYTEGNGIKKLAGKENFQITLDGTVYEFNCSLPSDSKANFEKSYIKVVRYG